MPPFPPSIRHLLHRFKNRKSRARNEKTCLSNIFVMIWDRCVCELPSPTFSPSSDHFTIVYLNLVSIFLSPSIIIIAVNFIHIIMWHNICGHRRPEQTGTLSWLRWGKVFIIIWNVFFFVINSFSHFLSPILLESAEMFDVSDEQPFKWSNFWMAKSLEASRRTGSFGWSTSQNGRNLSTREGVSRENSKYFLDAVSASEVAKMELVYYVS